MPRTTRSTQAKTAKPEPSLRGRMKLAAAAEYLGVSRRTVRRRIAEGVFTNATPVDCRGPRRTWFLWRDEVEVYATEGEAACRDLRRKLGRDRVGR